jgi:hypothetical protein
MSKYFGVEWGNGRQISPIQAVIFPVQQATLNKRMILRFSKLKLACAE